MFAVVEFLAGANGSGMTGNLGTCSRHVHNSDTIAKIATTPWGILCMGPTLHKSRKYLYNMTLLCCDVPLKFRVRGANDGECCTFGEHGMVTNMSSHMLRTTSDPSNSVRCSRHWDSGDVGAERN